MQIPTLVLDFEEVFSAEVLIGRIAPQLLAHYLVQLLSKGFCQAVSQRLHHDVVVVITLQANMGSDIIGCKPIGLDGVRLYSLTLEFDWSLTLEQLNSTTREIVT